MKYIHDGTNYIIFSAYEGIGHDAMAYYLNNNVQHAGFVHYKDKPTVEVQSYGKSTSLRLESKPFNYDEVNYVGISDSEYPIISNSKETLEKIYKIRDIKVAVWMLSKEGDWGECPVMYLGHPDRDIKACKLLKS